MKTETYLFDYLPKDLKSAHALIWRLRDKLYDAKLDIALLHSMLPEKYVYKKYKIKGKE